MKAAATATYDISIQQFKCRNNSKYIVKQAHFIIIKQKQSSSIYTKKGYINTDKFYCTAITSRSVELTKGGSRGGGGYQQKLARCALLAS
jgi:hypothetical protein